MGRPEHEFKYNGKELIEELGLNWNDYGARNYDAQLGRWHVVDALSEKYYSFSPYNYALNDPVLLQDFNGKDIDPKRFVTTQENAKALANVLSTKAGYAFFAQFARKGQSITVTIDGKKQIFTFNKDGARAKDLLVLQATDHPNMNALKADGISRTFEKGEKGAFGKEAKNADEKTNISNGVTHLITLYDGLSKETATITLAHEALVHTDKDAQKLNEIDKKVSDGTLKPGTKEYIRQVQELSNGADRDHKQLGQGQVSQYLNIATQLDKLKNTHVYQKLYEEDVKKHK
jgi:RHS repeat-associated protein